MISPCLGTYGSPDPECVEREEEVCSPVTRPDTRTRVERVCEQVPAENCRYEALILLCLAADVISPRTELSTVYSEETRQDCTQVPAIVCQNVTSQQCGAKQKPVQETVTNTECRTESVEVAVLSLLRMYNNRLDRNARQPWRRRRSARRC